MSQVTREATHQMAKDKSGELVQLVSDIDPHPQRKPHRDAAGRGRFRGEVSPPMPASHYEEVGEQSRLPLRSWPRWAPTTASASSSTAIWTWSPPATAASGTLIPSAGTVTDKQILGRGTSDMKAGVAGLLFAMKILKESGAELKGNIRLHLVSDEESGGEYRLRLAVRPRLRRRRRRLPHRRAHLQPTTSRSARRAACTIVLKAAGKSAHGSLGGFKGDNAILTPGQGAGGAAPPDHHRGPLQGEPACTPWRTPSCVPQRKRWDEPGMRRGHPPCVRQRGHHSGRHPAQHGARITAKPLWTSACPSAWIIKEIEDMMATIVARQRRGGHQLRDALEERGQLYR